MRSRMIQLTVVGVRTIAAIEGRRRFRTAQWCGIALLVTACAVILFDVIALRPGIDHGGATADRSVSPQEEQSGDAIAQPSDSMLQNTSVSNLTDPKANHFGMREALSAGFLQDNPGQPDFDDWPNIKPTPAGSN